MSREVQLPRGDAKTAAVRSMFDRIAPRYDNVNKILTFGLDVLWRKRSMSLLALPKGSTVVDLACGTGDYCRLLDKAGHRPIGVDISFGMLEHANTTAPLVQADALDLPFRDVSLDGVVSGFALRNFTDLEALYAELARVIRPGGRIVLLDAYKPSFAPLRWGHSAYFNHLVPRIGGLLSDKDAYSYLPASLGYLPHPDEMCAGIEHAGFKAVQRHTYMGGTVHVFSATRA